MWNMMNMAQVTLRTVFAVKTLLAANWTFSNFKLRPFESIKFVHWSAIHDGRLGK